MSRVPTGGLRRTSRVSSPYDVTHREAIPERSEVKRKKLHKSGSFIQGKDGQRFIAFSREWAHLRLEERQSVGRKYVYRSGPLVLEGPVYSETQEYSDPLGRPVGTTSTTPPTPGVTGRVTRVVPMD